MSRFYCSVCKEAILKKVFVYSMEKYGKALCMDHQRRRSSPKKLKKPKKPTSTPEAVKLANALHRRGWQVELEKFDGYKHIDIAITQVKVNIEVDGPQHTNDPEQALADLQRNYYSFKKGYLTLRIPNCLVQDDKQLEYTANCITHFLIANNEDDSDDY